MKADNLYDMIREELWDKHSISALLFLFDGGRELNFLYKNHPFGIFRHEKKWILSGETIDDQEFVTPWDLISKGQIDGEKFFAIWNEIEIKVLF